MPKAGKTDANKQTAPLIDPATNLATNEGIDLSAPENQGAGGATGADTTTPDNGGDPAPPADIVANINLAPPTAADRAEAATLPAAPQLEEADVDLNVRVNIVNAVELKPDAKYLVVLDENTYSREEAGNILAALRAIGINNAVGIMSSTTKSVQVIEQES